MGSSQATIYIPLQEAVEKYGISESILRDRVRSGRIAWGELPNGDLLIAEQDVDPSLGIKREDFVHLRGEPIGVAEAGRIYDLDPSTISI